jgi:hypothetical protein
MLLLISGIGLLNYGVNGTICWILHFPRLMAENPAFANNIMDNRLLFTAGHFLHFITH